MEEFKMAVLETIVKEKEKVEKSLKREGSILKNVDDITAVLEHIAELIEAGTPLPSESAYESYEAWQESAEKELKSYNSSLETIEKYKDLLVAYNYYIEQNGEATV